MARNINILRISIRLKELFDTFIDMSDVKNDQQSHFETRALAAMIIKKNCSLYKVNGVIREMNLFLRKR